MYLTTSKSKIITSNEVIQADGFASIEVTNTGTDEAIINDNIALPSGASWSWINHPDVTINQTTNIRFRAADPDKKVLVQMFYFKEHNNKPNRR